MKALRDLWADFAASYEVEKLLAVCEPKSLAAGVVGMVLILLVPAYIPPLARYGHITAHWVSFGLFVSAVSCSFMFYRTRGRGPWAPLFTSLDTLLAQSALTVAVVTTKGHVQTAYAVLQGLVMMAIHSRYYGLTTVFGLVLGVPVLGIVTAGVAFFGVDAGILVLCAGMVSISLWISNATRTERVTAAHSSQLQQALATVDSLANRSAELALTKTALTIGNTLHELRNHLNVLGAGLEFLSESMEEDPERRSALDDSVQSYQQARQVLETTMSKLKRATQQLDAAFDASQVLGDLAARLEYPGVKVRFEGNPTSFVVQGDEDDFRTVLLNLARNAVKAGAHEICLAKHLEDGGRSMRVEVRDDGSGIDQRVAEDLFKPFVSAREAEGGTGLGLYLSRRQIELMGGTIEVTSAEGKGTCFTITLPGRPEPSPIDRQVSSDKSLS